MVGHLQVIHGDISILQIAHIIKLFVTRNVGKKVEPIIGKTDLFIYPHGAQDRSSKAYQYLVHDEGFKFLAGVGPNNFTDIGNDSVYQDRVAIDGLNLYDFKYKLKPF